MSQQLTVKLCPNELKSLLLPASKTARQQDSKTATSNTATKQHSNKATQQQRFPTNATLSEVSHWVL